jgi:hypothetical protein
MKKKQLAGQAGPLRFFRYWTSQNGRARLIPSIQGLALILLAIAWVEVK